MTYRCKRPEIVELGRRAKTCRAGPNVSHELVYCRFVLALKTGYNFAMVTLNEILDAAQRLPSSERAQLIALLWDTTPPTDWGPPSPDWILEANRRSDEFDAGEVTGSDWATVRQRARKAAGLEN